MKKILSILIACFFVYFSFGQGTPITYTPQAAAGYQFKYIKADSGLIVAFRDTTTGRGDTRPGSIVCRPQDSLFYGWNGLKWERFGKLSTTPINKVDSVTVSGDTLKYWINGASYGWLLPNNAAWKLTGNVGVCDQCFLGTLDAADVRFKVDNTIAGRLNNQGGTSFGLLSDAHDRQGTAIGANSLAKNPQTTAIGANTEAAGDSSTAIGFGASSHVNHGVVLGDTNRAKVGIGTGYPQYPLDVRGTVRIKDGTEGAGKVLTSDANGAATWTTVSGTGTVSSVGTGYGLSGGTITSTGIIIVDTATLSGKYLRVGDTASMLYPYLRKADTANIRVRLNAGTNVTITGTYPNLTISSTGGGGGGSGTVTSVATGYGLSGGPVTTSGTILVDTSVISTIARAEKIVDDSSASLRGLYNSISFYTKNAGSGSDSLVYADSDTLKFKRPVGGYGVVINTTTTANNYRVDTSGVSTKAYAQKIVNDTAAALRSLIGTGGGQTPLTNHVNGAGYNINNLSGLEVKRVSGGTTTENKLLYSEQQDNASGWDNTGLAVTPNAETDLEGNTTMEMVNVTSSGGNRVRSVPITVTPSTTYTFSWDVKRGTATDLYYSVYDVTNGVDIVSPTNYYSSTSGSVTRVSFSVAIPAGCTQAYFYPIRDNISTGTAYIGRVQVASPGNTYIETTGTAAPPTPLTGSTNHILKIDSSGRTHFGDSTMGYKVNINGTIGANKDNIPYLNTKWVLGIDTATGQFVRDTLDKKIYPFANINAIGDSYTSGFPMSPVTQAYPYLLANKLGAGLRNNAIAGSTTAQLFYQLTNVHKQYKQDTAVIAMSGLNDAGNGDGYTTVRKIENLYFAAIVNQFLDTAVAANNAAVTAHGTWTTADTYTVAGGKAVHLSGLGRQSATTNDSLRYAFTGTNVAAGFLYTDSVTVTGGSFYYYIDGVLIDSVNTNAGTDGFAGVGDVKTYKTIPGAIAVDGLANGSHVLTIKIKSGNCIFDYFGTLRNAADCKPFFALSTPRLLSQSWIDLQGPTALGKNSMVDMYAANQKKAVAKIKSINKDFPAYFINVDKYQNPSTNFDNTGHWNPAGHRAAFQAVLDFINTDLPVSDAVNFAVQKNDFIDAAGINIPQTLSALSGTIQQNNIPILHSFPSTSANLFVGKDAGSFSSNSTYHNIGVGTETQKYPASSTGHFNASLGSFSLQSTRDASFNIGVGAYAGNAIRDGLANTITGHQAGAAIVDNNFNSMYGYQAGLIATGHRNTIIGGATGTNITTGNGSIIIGAFVDAPSATGSGLLNIGNGIFGEGMHNTTSASSTPGSGVKIGIKTSALDSALNIGGGLKINNGAAFPGAVWTATDNQGAGTWQAPAYAGILPIANGGTGTATPGLVAGTNITITGAWPNQTINASGGGGGLTYSQVKLISNK